MLYFDLFYLLPYAIPLLLNIFTVCYRHLGARPSLTSFTFPTRGDSFYITRCHESSSDFTLSFHDKHAERLNMLTTAFVLDDGLRIVDTVPIGAYDELSGLAASASTNRRLQEYYDAGHRILHLRHAAACLEPAWFSRAPETAPDIPEMRFFGAISEHPFVKMRVRLAGDYLLLYCGRSDVIPYDILYVPGAHADTVRSVPALLRELHKTRTPPLLDRSRGLNTFGVLLQNGLLDDRVLVFRNQMVACLHRRDVSFLFHTTRVALLSTDTLVMKMSGRRFFMWMMGRNRLKLVMVPRRKSGEGAARAYFESLSDDVMYTDLDDLGDGSDGLEFLGLVVKIINTHMMQQDVTLLINIKIK